MCQFIIVNHLICRHINKDPAYCRNAPLVRKHMGNMSWYGHDPCTGWWHNKRDDELYESATHCWACHRELSAVPTTETVEDMIKLERAGWEM